MELLFIKYGIVIYKCRVEMKMNKEKIQGLSEK